MPDGDSRVTLRERFERWLVIFFVISYTCQQDLSNAFLTIVETSSAMTFSCSQWLMKKWSQGCFFFIFFVLFSMISIWVKRQERKTSSNRDRILFYWQMISGNHRMAWQINQWEKTIRNCISSGLAKFDLGKYSTSIEKPCMKIFHAMHLFVFCLWLLAKEINIGQYLSLYKGMSDWIRRLMTTWRA